MRYLKTYEAQKNRFELLPDNVIQELKDICLELTDVGYRVAFNELSEGNNGVDLVTCILILIPPCKEVGRKRQIRQIIKEVIERIEDYMNSIGYNIIIGPNQKLKTHYFIYFTKK